MFRRRRAAGPPLAELLQNYLVRAEAIADEGGGDLWVLEPSVPAEILPEFTEAVVLFLLDHGIGVDQVVVLDGTLTARVVVLAAEFEDVVEDEDEAFQDEYDDEALDQPALTAFDLRPAELRPPAPRRPLDEDPVDELADEPDHADDDLDGEPEQPAAAVTVVDLAYESRSGR